MIGKVLNFHWRFTINYFFRHRYFILIFLIYPYMVLAQEKVIQEEWLQKDKANFLNFMEIILSDNKDINYFKKNLSNQAFHTSQDIGFGAKRYEFVRLSGYISNRIFICTYNNKIFDVRVLTAPDDIRIFEILAKKDSVIHNLLEKYWIIKPNNKNSELKESLNFEYRNDSLYSEFKRKVANTLGELEKIVVDSMLLKSYKLLLLPFEQYSFGYRCGIVGRPPEGRAAIEKIKNQNPTLLRNIIKGYNPEGRIYGVEALLELAYEGKIKLSANFIEIINKILKMDIPIQGCHGCIVSKIDPIRWIDNKLLKLLN